MNANQANRIPMTGLLTELGHQPQKEARGEFWYNSPFREENDPSFKVNTDRNIWFDFGLGKGGRTVDFAMHYYSEDVAGALRRLRELKLTGQISAVRPTPKTEPVQQKLLEVINVQPLRNKALIGYLAKREIPFEIAQLHVQEMYYTFEDKTYFALAFPNESNGYELRNPYFKRAQGKKAISVIAGLSERPESVMVFEGFIDFLSAATYRQQGHPEQAVIVLNSVTMKERAVAAIRELGVKSVYLYLDRDPSGKELTRYLQAELDDLTVQDCASLYADYNDYNDWLIARSSSINQKSR